MTNNLILSLIQIITFVSAFGGKGADTDGGVLVLTDKNFLVESLNRPYFLVEFYAPWCQHCQKLEPVYSAAAKMLQLHSPMLQIAKVDTDENKNLMAQFGIGTFPTFIVFKNGNYLEQWDGVRTEKGFYNAVVVGNKAQHQPTECKIISKMKKKDKQFNVFYFGPKDHPFYEGIYIPFFNYLQDDPQTQKSHMNVRYVTDPECAKDHGTTFPSIVWYKPFGGEDNEDKTSIYDADQAPNLEAFQDWYFFKSAPIPFKLTEYVHSTGGQGHPMLILFRSDKDIDEDYSIEFQNAAIENTGQRKIQMAYSSLDDEYPETLATYFNFQRDQLPVIRLMAGQLKFKPTTFTAKNATSELILQWIDDVMAGKSLAYARSQRDPKYNDGAVMILNTHNLQNFLSLPDTKKIIFYWKTDKKDGDKDIAVFNVRPEYWEVCEDLQKEGKIGRGLGKIIFGEFNYSENENASFTTEYQFDLLYFNSDNTVMEQFMIKTRTKILQEGQNEWIRSKIDQNDVQPKTDGSSDDNQNAQKNEL